VVTIRLRQSTSFRDLVGRLMRDIGLFVEQRLELFKAELRQDAAHIAKNVALVAAGALGASVGVLFLLLALGLWVGDLVGSTPGGLAIVGGGIALAGAGLTLWGARSLGRQRLIPETVRTLRRDAEWLQHQV
jgi:Putative Actinobacterial Holin-X, holin superfamily III